jgi:RNA polymerase sigma factor (sigma-70 family)
MEECLIHLSDEEKDFLFLRFVEELEYEEISAAMGMSETACRQRVSRAKKHLETVIEETDAGKNTVRGRVCYGHGK